ncbi:MAG: hypothetical protein R3F62_08805 [Planctomycetota bacterium]
MGLSLPVYFEARPVDFERRQVNDVPEALRELGLSKDATVVQAQVMFVHLTESAKNLQGQDPGRGGRLAAAFGAVVAAPEGAAPPSLFWSALANLINTIGKTGMAVGALIALVLDNLIPGTPRERGLAVAHH